MDSDVGQIFPTASLHRDHSISYALVCEKDLSRMGKNNRNQQKISLCSWMRANKLKLKNTIFILINTLCVPLFQNYIPSFEKRIDPDQLPSNKAGQSGSSVFFIFRMNPSNICLKVRKPVFWVSDDVMLKQACSTTESTQKIEILQVASENF